MTKSKASLPPLAILAMILVLSFLPRLMTLRQARLPSGEVVSYHLEGDELVFKTLVDQVGASFFNYSLQGTALLPILNQQNYDLPIFFHPPAFTYTLYFLSFLPLPLIPVLLNLATIALVFLIGCRLYDDERALWAAFLMAVCPVTWFLSQKIWIDNMVILMTTASVATALWAADRGSAAAYAAAGTVFGLAILSKVTAGLILLPIGILAHRRDNQGITVAKAAAFLLPASVLTGWWELTLKSYNDQWLPSAFPNADMIARFPFVAEIVARPWYFYFLSILTLSPVYLLALDAVRRRQPSELALGIWCLAFWILMTMFGLQGGGYQMRYVAPAYPALALLSAATIPRLQSAGMMGVMILVGYGLCNVLILSVLQGAEFSDLQTSVLAIVLQRLHEVVVLN